VQPIEKELESGYKPCKGVINTIWDHVHILCMLSKKIALAKLLEELKSHSSKWMKTRYSALSGLSEVSKGRTLQHIK
jgi:hypothetical protein